MTTSENGNDESLEIREYLDSILSAIRAVDAKVDAVDAKVDAVDAKVDAVDAKVDAVDAKVDAVDAKVDAVDAKVDVNRESIDSINAQMIEVRKRMDATDARMDRAIGELTGEIAGLKSRMTELEGKFDGVRNDLALVKGGHARNAMSHNLSRIADEFGFLFIAEMPQQATIDFAKVAAGTGIGQGEAESFRNADMVVHIRDDKGEPGYLAIEASFTVDRSDVRRANRNAAYLHQYTGLRAYGAVAGVEVLPDAQAEIDEGRVLFYSIRPRELQSE